MKIALKEPALCTTDELDQITNLILSGGEVASGGLYQRVKNAKTLAFAKDENDKIVSVGALKRPVESYKLAVFTKSGQKDEANRFRFELGYLFTDQKYRGSGLASGIIEKLVTSLHGQPCFTTLREDNKPSSHLLTKNGFSPLGSSYKGARGNYDLVIYSIN